MTFLILQRSLTSFKLNIRLVVLVVFPKICSVFVKNNFEIKEGKMITGITFKALKKWHVEWECDKWKN